MVAQLTGAEGPVSVRAMHVASPGQKKSGGGGAKHAPGHRSTSTIRENGSGAKCDARSYDTAEATKYPHFRPVAFEVGRTVRFFRHERYRKKFEGDRSTSCEKDQRRRLYRFLHQCYSIPISNINGRLVGKLTVLLHLLEEFDNDLGRRADEDLPLAALLGVGDCLETIGEY